MLLLAFWRAAVLAVWRAGAHVHMCALVRLQVLLLHARCAPRSLHVLHALARSLARTLLRHADTRARNSEELNEMLTAAGFEVVQNVYHRKAVENRKRSIVMKRVWSFVKARKPLPAQ